jgi:calcineurin-like phosphoesterase
VLPKGTGFVTDLGMTGPYNSIIGNTIDTVIEKFLTQMPNRGSVPNGPVMMNSVLIDVDRETGKAKSVERVDRMVD